MKFKHLFLGILSFILSFSAYSQVDSVSSMIIGSEIFIEQRFEDLLSPDSNIAKSSPITNYDSIIQEYHNSLTEIKQIKNEIDKMDSLLIVYDEKTKDLRRKSLIFVYQRLKTK